MKKHLFLLPISFVLSNVLLAQTILKGVIRDSSGASLSNSSVQVKGTTIFTIADDNGAFSIAMKTEAPYLLVISAVGFKNQEVLVPGVQSSPLVITLEENSELTELLISSRRRIETAQNVPIPISVVGGARITDAGAFNVNRLKELVPTVQLYTSNPRNTTLNIRGLGSTFGLTNDGIDPGVGFYVDGVYYARPAATTLDFIDVERIEVLRGPQGTLYGKNTTAGAFNVSTKKPSFLPGVQAEFSYGNLGFIQAKSSVTGALIKGKLAGRLSFSGTQRDGVLFNVSSQQYVNDLNNLGICGQLLFRPSHKIDMLLAGDATRQRPDGYAQVVAGVVPTKRPAYRQFEQIIADLHYDLPSRNAFDRLIDHNTPWRSGNDLGGVSLNIDLKLGKGTLTSTSAWRYWNWDPSNDRDFTALSVLSLSQATSKHQQWSQEIRYAGKLSSRVSITGGVFAISQDLKTDPEHIEESGSAQWRFSQSTTSDKWKTPGLFDGYGIKTRSRLKTFGGAVFGQLDWAITPRLHLLPGLRFNYDKKDVFYDRKTYGGLATTDPELIALKNLVYTDQQFAAILDESNFSGQLTLSYKASAQINSFATYSTSYKPVGVNLGGLPTSSGKVMTELARIKPEHVTHFEAGVKTNPRPGFTLNFAVYHTDLKDYQTQVQTAEVGVNRGYLANAEKVRVRGAELDASIRAGSHLSFTGALVYTDAVYVSFKNAPVPLEETGGASAFKDISGGLLPGVSKWVSSFGGELTGNENKPFGQSGNYFVAIDGYYRSSFSSSPSPSAYLNIDGYILVNGRFGFKATKGLTVFVWGRNLLDKDYYEQLLPAAGNAGHYAGVLGDYRTYGITLRYTHTP